MNILICSKNTKFLNYLNSILNQLIIKKDLSAKVVFKSTDSNDILNYIQSKRADVLFLDIDFKNTGIEFAEKIRKIDKSLYLIFITNHLEYVFSSFKVKPFDFLVNPITYEKLEHVLTDLFEDIQDSPNNFISLSNKAFIKLNDVYYISRLGMKLIFNTNYGNYELYSSFKKIEPKLPNNFVRSHKSYIVNINQIKSINAINNIITFKKNVECYIGLKYKSHFLEIINDQCFDGWKADEKVHF